MSEKVKTYKADPAKLNEIDIFQSTVFDGGGNLIAHGYGRTKEEAESNANLIVEHFELKHNSPLTEFEQVVRPVIKWLNENMHPHVTVIVTPTNAELLEGVRSTGQIMDYVKD